MCILPYVYRCLTVSAAAGKERTGLYSCCILVSSTHNVSDVDFHSSKCLLLGNMGCRSPHALSSILAMWDVGALTLLVASSLHLDATAQGLWASI